MAQFKKMFPPVLCSFFPLHLYLLILNSYKVHQEAKHLVNVSKMFLSRLRCKQFCRDTLRRGEKVTCLLVVCTSGESGKESEQILSLSHRTGALEGAFL